MRRDGRDTAATTTDFRVAGIAALTKPPQVIGPGTDPAADNRTQVWQESRLVK
jgi:hypothetical protein